MKKIILIVVVSAFVSGAAVAQTSIPYTPVPETPFYRHEVSLTYGVWSTSSIVDVFSHVLVTGLTGGQYSTDNNTDSGSFVLGYKYGVSPRVYVGGVFGYGYGEKDVFIGGEAAGEITNNYYTVAAEADYRYINRPKFKLYSMVGLGATFLTQKYNPKEGSQEKDNDTFFDFQVSALGVKFGNRIGGQLEVGFGYRGIVNAGVFARF